MHTTAKRCTYCNAARLPRWTEGYSPLKRRGNLTYSSGERGCCRFWKGAEVAFGDGIVMVNFGSGEHERDDVG